MKSKPITQEMTPLSWFRPGFFLLAFIIGFIGCVLLGHRAAKLDYHSEFTRFHPRISPEAFYYPTVDEMRAIVRARCRPDQVLVIVGGNSVLYGVGQPADQMWTRVLQERLGDQFAVVNFAFRGALATDGGAVIAETLRDEFPRQIYIANLPPLISLDSIGQETYQFILWEAFHRGLLEEFPDRRARIEAHWADPKHKDKRRDIWLRNSLNSIVRQDDFWNWIGYQYIFTVPTFYTSEWPKVIWPRKRLKDEEVNQGELPFSAPDRYGSAKEAIEMEITRGFTSAAYHKDENGVWAIIPEARQSFLDYAKTAFPDRLKPRTLLLVSRNSPWYVSKLTPDEMVREDLGYRDTVKLLESLNYGALEYGRDFSNADFGDRTHLAPSGGRKLAMVVAEKINQMVVDLDYLK
jgi:hypothetical protein